MAPGIIDHQSNNCSSKDVPWYRKDIGNMNESARKLLEDYSKIPSQQLTQRVLDVRDRAWNILPYPCIGTFLFLTLSIEGSALYLQIVKRLKGGQKLLDMGCCFAQDIRKLVYDGAPSENICGTDVEPRFIDLGYDLFLDKETLKSRFLTADALDPESALNQWDGEFDIIYAGFLLHFFEWSDQVAVAERMIRLLKPGKDSMILGKQAGGSIADEKALDMKGAGILWRHNGDSFARMWKEAGDRTNTK